MYNRANPRQDEAPTQGANSRGRGSAWQNPPTVLFAHEFGRQRALPSGAVRSSKPRERQEAFFGQVAADLGLRAFDLLDDVFLFVKDVDRCFVYYNVAFGNLMRLRSADELLGLQDEDINPEYLVENYRRHDQQVLSGSTLSGIVELVQNSSGGYDWFVTSKFPARDSKGTPIGVVGVTRKLYARQNRSEVDFNGLTSAVELILRNYSRSLSVQEMATAACLSTSEFSRSFKRHFGLSPHQYLRQIRINAACELLATSDHGLSDIAALTGFCDQSHLTNTFVRVKGITPRHYRHQFGALLHHHSYR